jgi:hypothetical protein
MAPVICLVQQSDAPKGWAQAAVTVYMHTITVRCDLEILGKSWRQLGFRRIPMWRCHMG